MSVCSFCWDHWDMEHTPRLAVILSHWGCVYFSCHGFTVRCWFNQEHMMKYRLSSVCCRLLSAYPNSKVLRLYTEQNVLWGQDWVLTQKGHWIETGQIWYTVVTQWTVKHGFPAPTKINLRFPETDGYPTMNPNLSLSHQITGQSIDQRKSDRKKNMNIRTRDGCTHVCMLMMYTPSCSLCLSVHVSGFVSQ